MEQISRLAGHGDVNTTRRIYAKPSPACTRCNRPQTPLIGASAGIVRRVGQIVAWPRHAA
jgi:hypothetical protein